MADRRSEFSEPQPCQQAAAIRRVLPELCETYRWIPRFLLALRGPTATLKEACETAGIHRSMVNRVKNNHPAFAQAMVEAHDDGVDVMVEEARRRALASSDRLLMFLLRAHRPEVYREPKGGAQVVAVVKIEWDGKTRIVERKEDLTDEELEAMANGTLTVDGDATFLFSDDDDEGDHDEFDEDDEFVA